jgi:hypothetical protein
MNKNKSEDENLKELNLRYCPEEEVGRNKQRFFVAKA